MNTLLHLMEADTNLGRVWADAELGSKQKGLIQVFLRHLIEDEFVDRVHGDWFKVLNRQGIPHAKHFKVGSWECPYHHSRVCFEMLARLARFA